MSPEPLRRVLEATGYLPEGLPAPGVHLGDSARRMRRGRSFAPDALWRGPSALTVYFKFEAERPNDEIVGAWRREIWNEGFAPLLWVVSPSQIELYNGFGRPLKTGDAAMHRLQTFRNIDAALDELDSLAGRLAMETGQFWLNAATVDRKTGVDQQLLSDLALLERDLVAANLERSAAQALIGRSIFTQYLVDRNIVDPNRLSRVCGHRTLPPILRDSKATERLFAWLSEKFNGDMFPPSSDDEPPNPAHLSRVADFLQAVDPQTGQTTLFPYQFDIIPVELISSIYEQFAHAQVPDGVQKRRDRDAVRFGVYYTRLSVVSLVLDEVMNGLTGNEKVLDLTCGSGVFLVEALRRLVDLRSCGEQRSRELIRSILYKQIYGVDISEAAIRVAAFSLYLAALELDPDPRPPEALTFRPLIGHTLITGDARDVEEDLSGPAFVHKSGECKRFDVIVGNPPWSFRGRRGTEDRRKKESSGAPIQPRGEGLDFVLSALKFAHSKTRFGMVLSAMPFFSGSKTGIAAAQHLVRQLAPITLVNLSNLSRWLFPAANMPAVVLFARLRSQRKDRITIAQVPWSPAGAKTHTFAIAPSDITSLSIREWERHPARLKAASVGHGRDLLLLDILTAKQRLGGALQMLSAELRDGLILGNPEHRTRDAKPLQGLPLLKVGSLNYFSIPTSLTRFDHAQAQWPRSRDTYKAPLLLIKEFIPAGGRVMTAVAIQDLVYTEAYFGISFPTAYCDAAHLLAAILSSALGSWFFIMTASEFGLWKQRLLMQDVAAFPAPDLAQAARSKAGRRILSVAERLGQRPDNQADWLKLDEAVCDLYSLDAAERTVVRDGLVRAKWEWRAGLINSTQPADIERDLCLYAGEFVAAIDAWLAARMRRRIRAEVFNLPLRSPLRIVRFVLEEQPGPSKVQVLNVDGELGPLLEKIGKRLNVRLTTSLIGERELRVHGTNEVIMVKPAARRHWMGISALEDADAVISESIGGAAV